MPVVTDESSGVFLKKKKGIKDGKHDVYTLLVRHYPSVQQMRQFNWLKMGILTPWGFVLFCFFCQSIPCGLRVRIVFIWQEARMASSSNMSTNHTHKSYDERGSRLEHYCRYFAARGHTALLSLPNLWMTWYKQYGKALHLIFFFKQWCTWPQKASIVLAFFPFIKLCGFENHWSLQWHRVNIKWLKLQLWVNYPFQSEGSSHCNTS